MLSIIKKIRKFFYPFKYENFKIIEYHKLSKKLKKHKHFFLSRYFENKIYKKYNCIISSDAIIDESVQFPHPIGIVIGKNVVIEKDVIIFQNVTIGRKNKDISEYPIIRKGTIIYCNSTIIGDIEVAENTTIGANSVLMKSTEENSIYVGSPARKINEEIENEKSKDS